MRKRSIFASLLMLLLGMAIPMAVHAMQRTFPANSYQVQLQAVNEPYIVVDGTSLLLPPGALIFNQSNTTIVRSALPVGAYVRLQFDLNGNIQRLWVLGDDEITPIPLTNSILGWITGSTFVPPQSVNQ